jgi:hypothetical protein
MDVNENGNNNNDLRDRNNKFYLHFTQIGKIIIVDEKKYFRCESDGQIFPIRTKGNYPSQDTDIINQLGCFSIIPVCDSNGAILAYHVIELNKSKNSEVFIIQARVKQTIRTGAVQLLISLPGSSNLVIPVQINNKFRMTTSRIYLCQGYREADKIYISNYALIPETITPSDEEKTKVSQLGESSSVPSKLLTQKAVEPITNVDKYAEVVASNHDGVLIYIPANQILSEWRPVADKKYKLVTMPDGIKITNAAPVNIDDTAKIDTPKTCEYCIYEVNSICSKTDSPLFSSVVANDSTCIKCTV